MDKVSIKSFDGDLHEEEPPATTKPSAGDFLRLAVALEALEPNQCSGYVYRTRCHLAEQLRMAQARPEEPHNVDLLRAVLWLLRPSRASF